MPDSDFEEAINEEQDRILEEKREKILRDLELKARYVLWLGQSKLH